MQLPGMFIIGLTHLNVSYEDSFSWQETILVSSSIHPQQISGSLSLLCYCNYTPDSWYRMIVYHQLCQTPAITCLVNCMFDPSKLSWWLYTTYLARLTQIPAMFIIGLTHLNVSYEDGFSCKESILVSSSIHPKHMSGSFFCNSIFPLLFWLFYWDYTSDSWSKS